MRESCLTISIIFHNQLGDHLPQQGWTKWGGAMHGLKKEELDEWYCQSCGEKQTRVLPSYMIPVDQGQRDFVRVCAGCKAKARVKRVSFYWDLLELIKTI